MPRPPTCQSKIAMKNSSVLELAGSKHFSLWDREVIRVDDDVDVGPCQLGPLVILQ